MRLRHRLIDIALALPLLLAGPFLHLAARTRWSLRLSRRIQDAFGVTIVRNHYYEPVFTGQDLALISDGERLLPGVDFNREGQLATLGRFTFADELAGLDGAAVDGQIYRYGNQKGMFGQGDADALYCFIRAFKPRMLIEIGCGQSSIVAQLALRTNLSEDPERPSRHVCFEPFHNGWLKDLGPEFRAERIECIDLDVFRALQPNDIVFIDSTHVLRPNGDIEHAFLRILPLLPAGVLVQIHDIFSPRDYKTAFLKHDRRFWTEQYVLEAFLSCNPEFEVLLALNDMHKRREPRLYDAIPVLADMPDWDPGSFWIRRRAKSESAL